jgi:ABC-type multidrug transport system ATPase subunit
LLELDGLERSFGKREVVKSLSLEIGAGERVALFGPNGSGKSTVLRCVAGTLTPTAGRVSIGGFPAGSVEARGLVGTSLSQERSFYLRLSGAANLLLFARLRGLSNSQGADEVQKLEVELGIGRFTARPADTYSAGMLQQLAFARALLGRPSLLLLDEPTRSLDEAAIGRFWRALDQRPETAVLMATHNHDDLDRCHSRIDLPV